MIPPTPPARAAMPPEGYETWLDACLDYELTESRAPGYARAELAALRTRVADLEVALNRYGDHDDLYGIVTIHLSDILERGVDAERQCTCGFSAALAREGERREC